VETGGRDPVVRGGVFDQRRPHLPQVFGSFVDRPPMVPSLYVLGRVGALATADRLRDGALDPATYREFLAAGNSRPPAALLADDLGLDLSGGVAAAAADAYADLVGR